jgi:hypothetical protein
MPGTGECVRDAHEGECVKGECVKGNGGKGGGGIGSRGFPSPFTLHPSPKAFHQGDVE